MQPAPRSRRATLPHAYRDLRTGRSLAQRLGAQADALTLEIHAEHADTNQIADAYDLVRILDEPIRELGNVNQAVLVHADVDERAERGDVRDPTFEHHARAHVFDVAHVVTERGRFELGAR